MNNQPYDIPTRHWPPRLSYPWFSWGKLWRRRALRRQSIVRVDAIGLEHLQRALLAGQGILLTPNHSFHWDSYCLLEAADRLNCPFYIMTAWQVFQQSRWFERTFMQRCGCFSVDRESNDLTAIKTAVDILQHRREPLVIFPEGDVYHTNDRITPLRDGAAAMAMLAARKTQRTVVIIPTAIKRWFVDDPHPSMTKTVEKIEQRLYWRPERSLPLDRRILRVAEGLLSLIELERFGQPRTGSLTDRKTEVSHAILESAEQRYGIQVVQGKLPERVKEVRRRIIQQRHERAPLADDVARAQWADDMEDMFLVTQLYSYPGDYLMANPTWERLAETVDKLEEDALGAPYPTPRGRSVVQVGFSDPIELPSGKAQSLSASELTSTLHSRIQELLHTMNQNFDRNLDIP